MVKIDRELLQELRDHTGLGLMDCRKALEATNGDFDQGMAKRMECIYHPFYVDNLEDTDSSEDIMAPINQDMTVDIDAFEAFYHSRFDQEN